MSDRARELAKEIYETVVSASVIANADLDAGRVAAKEAAGKTIAVARDALAAVRAEALEQAAKVAEARKLPGDPSFYSLRGSVNAALDNVVSDIRQLAEKGD